MKKHKKNEKPDEDLSNGDLFQCENCGSVLDIEDSVQPNGKHGGLFCPECSIDGPQAEAAKKAAVGTPPVDLCLFSTTPCKREGRCNFCKPLDDPR
jgi:hypothetical protein